mmetsp:Transcript_31822/g.38682  ORF Transcript_31822/g.38682 Transcript_31822/m.38682 type:complete len:440 (+) Transcript_31822:170-1489(+)
MIRTIFSLSAVVIFSNAFSSQKSLLDARSKTSSHRRNFGGIQKMSNSNDGNIFKVTSAEMDEMAMLTQEESTIVDVFRRCGPSVAYVTSSVSNNMLPSQRNRRRRRPQSNDKEENDKNDEAANSIPLGSGSGFTVHKDGYIVTNYHVIQRAYQINNATESVPKFLQGLRPKAIIKVRGLDASDSKLTTCRIVDVKPELDIAILKAEKYESNKATPLKYADSTKLLVGQRVVAIGNPFGLEKSVTSGVVSALNRNIDGVAGNKIRNCVQTDAAINPGNSGGPLLNSRGQVIGVNTMILSTTGSFAGVGFAVPASSVRKFADEAISKDFFKNRRDGDDYPGWLGLEIGDDSLSSSLLGGEKKGVVITSVKKDSPALEAKLKGDGSEAIVALCGSKVTNASELLKLLCEKNEGDKIDLTVESLSSKNRERRLVYITLKKKPV